jgi:hypothetical protein
MDHFYWSQNIILNQSTLFFYLKNRNLERINPPTTPTPLAPYLPPYQPRTTRCESNLPKFQPDQTILIHPVSYWDPSPVNTVEEGTNKMNTQIQFKDQDTATNKRVAGNREGEQ